MLDILGIAQKDKEAIAESFEALKKKYGCVIDNDLKEALANRITESKILEDYHTVSIKNVFKINENGKEFYILSIYLTEVDLKVDFTALIFGVVVLKNHYDPVLIQPETTWDKLTNIFGIGRSKIIEFKGAKNNYRVTVNGKNHVKLNLPDAFLNELSGVEKVYAEFYDNTFLSTFNKPVSVKDTLSLAEFLSRIAPALG